MPPGPVKLLAGGCPTGGTRLVLMLALIPETVSCWGSEPAIPRGKLRSLDLERLSWELDSGKLAVLGKTWLVWLAGAYWVCSLAALAASYTILKVSEAALQPRKIAEIASPKFLQPLSKNV